MKREEKRQIESDRVCLHADRADASDSPAESDKATETANSETLFGRSENERDG